MKEAQFGMMTQVFAIAGIISVLAGGVSIWAGTVQVPSLLQLPEFQAGHLKALNERRDARQRGYENHSEDERKRSLLKADEAYAEELAKLHERTVAEFYEDRSRMVTRNGVGIALIGLGSILQGAAVLFV
jgi:hypothetical protein